jgi:hypothetical protein
MYETAPLKLQHKVRIFFTYSIFISMGTYLFLSLLSRGLWRYLTLDYLSSFLVIFLIALILSVFVLRHDFRHRIMETLTTDSNHLHFKNAHHTYKIESKQLFKVSVHHLFYVMTPYRKLYFYFKGPKQTFILTLVLPKKDVKKTLEDLQSIYRLKA